MPIILQLYEYIFYAYTPMEPMVMGALVYGWQPGDITGKGHVVMTGNKYGRYVQSIDFRWKWCNGGVSALEEIVTADKH